MHAPPGMFDSLRDRDPVEIGGYRLYARLGSGGMGEVFLSFDGSARPVAVKVLRGEFADDRQFRARFAHEVRAARRVNGPNIAPLLDADPDAETPWLATAYVAGPTLADTVALYGPLPVASVIVLIAGIAEALRSIHAAGIVHRDLKPANVVLGAEGLRVIDFGIARAADATPITLTGMMVGSPQYVAPEQALGEPPAPAGDVFSLGALAHYAATGRHAFGEGPRIAVLYRIVNEHPDLAGCPRQIRSLIESCLARDPADRPDIPEILEMCTPDEPPRTAADWLPPSAVFAIESYRAALADVVTADRTRAIRPAAAPASASASASTLDTHPSSDAPNEAPPEDQSDVRRHPRRGSAAFTPNDGHPPEDQTDVRRHPRRGSTALTPNDGHPPEDQSDVRHRSRRGAATFTPNDGHSSEDRSGVGHRLRRGPVAFTPNGGHSSEDRSGVRHRLRRGAIALGAALAVSAVAVAIAFQFPSGDSSPASALSPGGTTQNPGGQTGGWPPSGVPGGQPPPPFPGGPPGGPPPGGPPPGAAGPGPLPPTPTARWWSGTVRITGAGLWLDARPPSSAQGGGDIRELASAPTAEISSGAPEIKNLARWTGAGTPTAAQCLDLAFTHGTSQLQVGVGDTVCVLTAYRQVAVLRITSLPAGDSGAAAAVTVWGTTSG